MSDAKTLSLDEMIAESRKAKASEIASATMGKHRNQSVPTGPAKLNGRGGISKRIASGSGIGNSAPVTGLNGKWTHDLHQQSNPSRVSKLPTTLSPAIARSLQNNRLFAALHGTPTGPASDLIPSGPRNGPKFRSTNIRGGASGFSIRGSAGPFVVQASNFAPGTTAEDIKMAMLPLGKILSCIILAANPTVICEIVFEKKEAADQCISQYNNQLADGRVLHLSLKPGPPVSRLMHQGGLGPRAPPRSTDPNAQREEADRQRRLANVSFQDGSFGVRPPPLYSDALVQRGRGFNGGNR